MKHLKQVIKIEPTDALMQFELIIAENTGGADIPDPGDIPGGVLHSGKDLLDGVYAAWREKVVEQKIIEWMRIHHKTSFP